MPHGNCNLGASCPHSAPQVDCVSHNTQWLHVSQQKRRDKCNKEIVQPGCPVYRGEMEHEASELQLLPRKHCSSSSKQTQNNPTWVFLAKSKCLHKLHFPLKTHLDRKFLTSSSPKQDWVLLLLCLRFSVLTLFILFLYPTLLQHVLRQSFH